MNIKALLATFAVMGTLTVIVISTDLNETKKETPVSDSLKRENIKQVDKINQDTIDINIVRNYRFLEETETIEKAVNVLTGMEGETTWQAGTLDEKNPNVGVVGITIQRMFGTIRKEKLEIYYLVNRTTKEVAFQAVKIDGKTYADYLGAYQLSFRLSNGM